MTASPHSLASQWPRWGLALLLVVAIGGFYLTGFSRYLSWEAVQGNLDTWQTQVNENRVQALLVFFAVYVAVTALSLPAAAILTMLAGALFGRWIGTGVVSVASTLGATLALLISRYLLSGWVQRKFADRLVPINQGIDKDGGYYLFTLRLVPVVPFFLINLGMGLTPIRVTTFAFVSWLGMLLGTFLYVNAGTELASLDSPADLLSVRVLGALALLGIVPLVIRKLVQWQVSRRAVGVTLTILLLLGVVGVGLRTYFRYQTAEVMELAVREYDNAEYPEDPSGRSVHHGQYNGRRLTLVQKDATHFNFVFESDHEHVAKVEFKDVDVSLFTIHPPTWALDDPGNLRIALTDREWNRQQVRFGGPESAHVEVTGGNGWEREHLYSAELARNCLNAGLWEVLLFEKDGDGKAMYYQGWFTFPLGHYQAIFEANTGLPYWKHWYYLEHWFDPVGTPMALDQLREVVREQDVIASFDRGEPVIAQGEQIRKRRTTIGENIVTWNDFYDGRKVRFATFIPPGRYSNAHPWKNEYRRINRFDKAIVREVKSPAFSQPLHELELVFSSSKRPGITRFLVSGFDWEALPRLPVQDYPKGLYMPMGIGVPPFYQSYDDLQKSPPQNSPYFSVLLDDQDQWLDHHSFAIDGPVMHRDVDNPQLLHVYLLSYERHSLIGHFIITMP